MALAKRKPAPAEPDGIVVLHNISWEDYEGVLRMRGDRSVPRVSFLEGELELMSPSWTHESVKSKIGCLVEVWCLEHGLDFQTVGSWTLKERPKEAGVEPDECYVFGDAALAAEPPSRPDLAIEVVWTSGGIDKLEIYRRLGVREVWFWEEDVLSIHQLRGERYVEAIKSKVLPGIDTAQLLSFLPQPTSVAIRQYRAALQSKRSS